MKPDYYQHVCEIFDQARELDPSRREEYLERACGDDPSLLAEVVKLLENDRHADSKDFLEQPAVRLSPGLRPTAPWPTGGPGDQGSEPPATDNLGQFQPGTILADRFKVIHLQGMGGMGEVYRADDLKLGQPVALKFLPARFCQDPTRLSKFYDEVRLAQKIVHPNVCHVYDLHDHKGRDFLSMEYIEGGDLASLLRSTGPLRTQRGYEIAHQICWGLHALHEKDILHRDLKPANVMLDGRGEVRIVDFGLAQLIGEPAEMAGTLAYMSPEQLQSEELTKQSDIFSLGLVLFESLSGKCVSVSHWNYRNYETSHISAIGVNSRFSAETAIR